MAIRIESPYRNEPLPWVKGNLHTHTTESDGTRAPQDVVDTYAARGYGFLMISDHDRLTPIADLDARGMTLIPGNEISADGPHVLHVDAKSCLAPMPDRQTVIDAIAGEGGFAVVAHPNWQKTFAHCPQNLLEQWTGYTGIEIYNGVIRRLDGSPLATDRWDRLLGLGRRVWGFAHDDSHRPGDDELAWNMVQSETRDFESILDALRSGRFYASTGVTIDSIRTVGATIDLRTADAQRIVVHTDYGHHEAAFDSSAATFTVPGGAPWTYLRFTCWGRGEAMAWTQPFFLHQT